MRTTHKSQPKGRNYVNFVFCDVISEQQLITMSFWKIKVTSEKRIVTTLWHQEIGHKSSFS